MAWEGLRSPVGSSRDVFTEEWPASYCLCHEQSVGEAAAHGPQANVSLRGNVYDQLLTPSHWALGFNRDFEGHQSCAQSPQDLKMPLLVDGLLSAMLTGHNSFPYIFHERSVIFVSIPSPLSSPLPIYSSPSSSFLSFLFFLSFLSLFSLYSLFYPFFLFFFFLEEIKLFSHF